MYNGLIYEKVSLVETQGRRSRETGVASTRLLICLFVEVFFCLGCKHMRCIGAYMSVWRQSNLLGVFLWTRFLNPVVHQTLIIPLSLFPSARVGTMPSFICKWVPGHLNSGPHDGCPSTLGSLNMSVAWRHLIVNSVKGYAGYGAPYPVSLFRLKCWFLFQSGIGFQYCSQLGYSEEYCSIKYGWSIL